MDNTIENITNEIYTNETIVNETLDTRVDSIEKNVSTIMQADLFLVSFIVVCVVCVLLYKAVDNFISF